MLPPELHWLQVHARQRTDDFEVAEFFRADAIEAPNGILHCCGEFAVRPAKLLEEHIAESRVRPIDTDRVHELLMWWYICAASMYPRGYGTRKWIHEFSGWTTFFDADSLREAAAGITARQD